MVKTRIAPSPTGDPHIGTAYTALFNYAFSKKEKGKFVLRIEDTDRTRLVKDSESKILDLLEWLNLSWDEGPIRQSSRLNLYQKTSEELVKNGAAYYCDCSTERLNTLRKQQQSKKEAPGYDGKCRRNPPKDLKKDGFVVRLKVPESGETSFEDKIRGKINFQNKDVDDAVILKSDGWPTYHLAVVVDDHDMKISHVIRAEEWLSSTPKHVLIYNALGINLPIFIHLPLLRNKDKSKISKRKNPISLSWFKDEGFLPEAIINYLALMGWSMPDGKEIFSLDKFVKEFDVDRIDPTGPIFDIEKLEWLNGEWIRSFPKDKLIDKIKGYTKRDHKEVEKILPLVFERMKRLSEFDSLTNYFFDDKLKVNKDLVVQKNKTPKETGKMLRGVNNTFIEMNNWENKNIDKNLVGMQEKSNWSKTDFFQTIRVSVSGSIGTPPLSETLEAIGKEKTTSRIGTVTDDLPGE